MEHQIILTAASRAAVIAWLTILCLTLHSGSAFLLKASHKQLTFAADESLTLKCAHFPEEDIIESEMATVREMRLVKRVGSNGWHTLAQIWLNDQEIGAQSGLDVTGKVGTNVTDAYLNVVWYHTLPEATGTYRCDIVGTDRHNDLILEKTNLVTVFDKNATTKDIFSVSQQHLENLQFEFNRYKSDTEEQLRSLRNQLEDVSGSVEYQANKTLAMSAFVSDVGEKLQAEMQEKFEVLQSSLLKNATTCGCQSTDSPDDERKSSTEDDSGEEDGSGKGESETEVESGEEEGSGKREESVTEEGFSATTTAVPPTMTSPFPPEEDDERRSTVWPKGKFGLPKPEAGCPENSDGARWSSGHFGYHTESTEENRDNVSVPNHLAGPVARVDDNGNHFMFLQFCVKSNRPGMSPIPTASVNSSAIARTGPVRWPAGSYCINRAGGRCPVGFSSGFLDIDEEDTKHVRQVQRPLPDMLFFCCRKDGPAHRPLRLPTQKPFFLFRFGGECQAVREMAATAESVTIDTENLDNSDRYQNEFHPDGHIEDVHLKLCYYSGNT